MLKLLHIAFSINILITPTTKGAFWEAALHGVLSGVMLVHQAEAQQGLWESTASVLRPYIFPRPI